MVRLTRVGKTRKFVPTKRFVRKVTKGPRGKVISRETIVEDSPQEAKVKAERLAAQREKIAREKAEKARTKAEQEVLKEAAQQKGTETAGQIVRRARVVAKEKGFTTESVVGALSAGAVEAKQRKELEAQFPGAEFREAGTEIQRTKVTLKGKGVTKEFELPPEEVTLLSVVKKTSKFGGEEIRAAPTSDFSTSVLGGFQEGGIGGGIKGGLEDISKKLSKQRGVIQQEITTKEALGVSPFVSQVKGLGIGAGVSVVGTGLFAQQIATSPIKTSVDLGKATIDLGKRFVGGETIAPGLKEVVLKEPGFVLGFAATEVAIAKGTGVVVRKFPVKPKLARVDIPFKEKLPVLKEIKGSQIILDKTLDVTKTKKITTFGLEGKTRGVRLVTKTDEGFLLGSQQPRVKLPLEDISKAIPAPKEAIGTKALVSSLDLSPEELVRIESLQTAGRAFKGEKGLKIKEVIFPLEGFKDPVKASKVIGKKLGPLKPTVFGSALTAPGKRKRLFGLLPEEETAGLLPKGFGSFTPGSDVDFFFEKLPKSKIEPIVADLAKDLQKIGENIRVSPTSKTVLEFPVKGQKQGAKALEFKSGIDQDILLGESPAPAGGLGFKFADIKAGQLGKTIKFGEFEGITIGEQFVRKEVASAFFRGAEFGDTPKAFQVAGVFPKGRRTKDIAGAIITGEGIVALRRRGVLSSLREGKTARGEKALSRFVETFTPEQQELIKGKITELKTQDFKIPLGTVGDIAIKPPTPTLEKLVLPKRPLFTEKQPELGDREFFHGTPRENVQSILKQGIKTNPLMDKETFLTKDLEFAKTFFQFKGRENVVFKVKLTKQQQKALRFDFDPTLGPFQEFRVTSTLKPSQIELISGTKRTVKTTRSIKTPKNLLKSPRIRKQTSKSLFEKPSTKLKRKSPSTIDSTISKSVMGSTFKSPGVKSPKLPKSPSPSQFKSPFKSIIPKSPGSKFPKSPSPGSPGSPTSRFSSFKGGSSFFTGGGSSFITGKGFRTPPPPFVPIKIPTLQLTPEKFKPRKELRRKFQFTPSLVALEERIRGRKPSVLTGIEVRAIPRVP